MKSTNCIIEKRINSKKKFREQAKDMYQKQAERNSTELTRKNRELVDKIQELDILKMKYEEALANYQALNTKVMVKLFQSPNISIAV